MRYITRLDRESSAAGDVRRRTSARAGLGAAIVLAMAVSPSMASVWTGGTGTWSSNGNPGWNGTGVPNAAGAVAAFDSGTAGTTTQDVSGGVTVGTITLSGSGNTQRAFTTTNPITLNNNSSTALIQNSSTGTSSNRMSFGSGTYTLAGNLRLENGGSSTNTSGSITFNTGLRGTGNLTVWNVSNNFDAGRISFSNESSFTGNILIEKGILSTGGANNSLGLASTNALTLGSVGNGSATLVTTGSNTTVSNHITLASGTGGTLTLGARVTSGSTANSTYSGTVTLNDNLTVTSAYVGATSGVTAHVFFTNVLSGTGGVTKIGPHAMTLSGQNTYIGDTTVNDGTLTLASTGELRFRIQDDNVSNRVQGSAAVNLNGIFRIDISALTATSGSWNLVDVASLNESFHADTFGVAFVGGPLFSEAVDGVHTSGDWTFTESTGTLILVPEPGSAVLAGSALLALARRQRRTA